MAESPEYWKEHVLDGNSENLDIAEFDIQKNISMEYSRESMIPKIGSLELRFKNEERMFLVIVTLSAASASNLGSCCLSVGVIW